MDGRDKPGHDDVASHYPEQQARSLEGAISAFTRVHSPSQPGVNALEDALGRHPGTMVQEVVDMEQKCEPLNQDDIADLAAKRAWVCGHYDEAARHKYDTLDGKLSLLDAILRNKWIAADETLKLQCLGVTFGDALAQKLGLTWVAVEDQYGRDPALALDGTSILLFPLTSISKRIERGEDVEVYELFEDSCSTIERLRRDGTYNQ